MGARRLRPMADAEVLYEVDGAVARVTINRPERRNSMSYGVMQGLRDAVAAAKTLENNAPAARSDRPDLDPIHLSDAGIKALRPGQQLDGVDEAATELQAFAAEMKRALSSF